MRQKDLECLRTFFDSGIWTVLIISMGAVFTVINALLRYVLAVNLRPCVARAMGTAISVTALLSPVRAHAESALANSAVSSGPVPPWVENLEWKIPVEHPPGESAQTILSDGQDRLFANGGDYYFHQVIRLLTAQAVAEYSQQTNEITPDFDTVTWHTLKVYRDGKPTDRLPTIEFKKLQREPGLEAQVLTGQTTYVALLDDIRVGDIVETAYTLHYTNTLMGGHASARHYLGAANSIIRERVVIRVPRTLGEVRTSFVLPEGTKDLPDALYRNVSLKSALEEHSNDNERVFSWEGHDLPAIEFDAGMPGAAYPYWPMLLVTTCTSWSDVADWAVRLFEFPAQLPNSLVPLVEKWKSEPDQSRRLDAAIHWVQNDVRYFALDLARHPVKPRPIADVCVSRFGDCKDKALLLATILRALGFEAWPALTNTYWCDRLTTMRPDPRAFNHAIVAYQYDGKLRWIDPTLTQQHGTSGQWELPPYRAALIIRAGENQLSDCDTPNRTEPDTETIDQITIDEKSGDAKMTTRVTVRGLQADLFRPSLTAQSQTERARNWFNFISTFYRRLDEVKGPICTDAHDRNEITISAEYRLPGFVSHEGGRTAVGVYGYALRAVIDTTRSRRRHWPYALAGHRYIRHRIEVDLPFEMKPEQLPEFIKAPGFEYRIERGVATHRLVVQHDLRITADAVSADDVPQFADDLDEVMNSLTTAVFASENSPRPTEPPRGSPPSGSTASTVRTPGTAETH